MRSAVCGLLAAMGLTSCGTDPNVFHVGCGRVDDFDIGSGLTPSIGWSPDCSVASLSVYKAVPVGPGDVPTLPGSLPGITAGAQMWHITAPPSAGNVLDPSIRYGHAPELAIEGAPALPLVSGQLYLVVVEVVLADGAPPWPKWTGQFRP
jgi:hypothetical protein